VFAERIRSKAKDLLPEGIRRWVRNHQLHYLLLWPRRGLVNCGDLRRLAPISRHFGFDRGLPIDRYYIERFLTAHSLDIRGRVLEMGDDSYTWKFGGNRVTRSDVLHYVPGNPKATIVADLTSAHDIPSNIFDCIIFTQTLQFIYDVRAALSHLYRILKPGGVLLVTSTAITKICRREGIDPWGEYWRFTAQGAGRLFQEYFPKENYGIEVRGNVWAAIAFLHGLATEELNEEELDYLDPDYEIVITIRAVKPQPAAVSANP
jgi:SAM-dependent methyltransferase